MKRVIPIFIAIVLAASSCGDKSKQIGNATAENCLLALVDTSVVVKWTAYKTTEKIGVSGTFVIVSVGGYTKAETAADVLKNASFEIPVTSIISGVADRDGKIFGYFFSNMVNTSLLAGQVLEAGQEQWKVGLVMNDVRDTLIFNFIESEGNVSLVGTLDLAKWNALASADSLNKVCYDLHKGADGVSKLWPDVKLEISANLKEDCN